METPWSQNVKWWMESSHLCRFRSYAGDRRVNSEHYDGPIWYKDTNFLYEGPLNGKLIELKDGEDVSHLRKIRKNSRFAYSNEWT